MKGTSKGSKAFNLLVYFRFFFSFFVDEEMFSLSRTVENIIVDRRRGRGSVTVLDSYRVAKRKVYSFFHLSSSV